MSDTLQIVLPIFIMIAMGFGAAATGLLDDKTADGLSDFVFVIGIPLLLFRTLATAPLPQAQPWFYWLAYFGALFIVWSAMSVAGQRWLKLQGQELAIAGFSAIQSNTVFIGIPLIFRAYGDAGAVPMFLLIAIHLPVTMTVATLLVERADGGERQWGEMFKRLVLHPIILGILAGAAWRLSALPMPDIAGTTLKMIGEAALPVALFALGMTLKRYGFTAPPAPLAAISILKLLVHPALVYVLAFHVLPVPPIWAAVAVIFAACPSGVNAYLLASRYNTGVALSSGAIAATTGLAVITTSFWLWVVSGVR